MVQQKNSKQQSIQQFKEFVREHPKLTNVVRDKEKTWQELFEEWYLLGAEDPTWRKYHIDSEKKQETASKIENKNIIKSLLSKATSAEDGGILETITGYVRKIDPDQVQGQITNVRSALDNIQKIVSIFNPPSGGGGTTTGERKESKPNPFTFRKD